MDSKPKCIICDIDGTIANLAHRRHHVKKHPPDWKSFFEEMNKDTPNKQLDEVLSLINSYSKAAELYDNWEDEEKEITVIFVSGRPDNYRKVTKDWLDKNTKGYWYNLYMRSSGDYRADFVVKEEILKEKILPNYDVLCVIDDRPSVVDMWRRNGLLCFAMPYDDAEKFNFSEGEVSLVLMVGPSGGGKSTWVSKNIHTDLQRNWLHSNYKVNPFKQFVLSSDQLRFNFTGAWDDMSKQQEVFGYIHEAIALNARHGITTIVDATNLRNRHRKEMVSLVPEWTKVLYIVCDQPLKEKLEAYRVWKHLMPHTKEEVIRKHDQVFRSNLKDILAGDNFENVEIVDTRAFFDY